MSTRPDTDFERLKAVVEPFGVVVRWSRFQFYDQVAEKARLDVDKSTISILSVLARHGPLTASELARRLALDRSTISRQISAMVAAGLIERIADVSDARSAILVFTKQGKAMHRRLADAWHSVAVDLIADWSRKDQEDLIRLLGMLAEQMESDYG